MCVSKVYKGRCLWFLVFLSMSSSMFTTGTGISIPERIKVVKSEHCIFMFMPVDVPCISRKDHSIANITKPMLPNVHPIGNYFASVIKTLHCA